MSPRINAKREMPFEEKNISDDITMVSLIGDLSWDKLSVKDKLDVLQAVANIEQYRLGMQCSCYRIRFSGVRDISRAICCMEKSDMDRF